MADANTGFDYLKMAEAARVAPEPPSGGPGGEGVELPPIFETKEEAEQHSRIETEANPNKPAISSAYRLYNRTFTLWRPWENCKRCMTAIDMGQVILPADSGDYRCPHNQNEEFKAIINKCLRGDGVIAVKDYFFTPPPGNARCVYLEWMELDDKELERLKKEQEAKKETRVFPPDVAGAFEKGK